MTTTSTHPAGSNGTAAPVEPASLRDRIKANATVFPTETVEAWGQTVEVRSMTVAEQARLVDKFTRVDGTRDVGGWVPAVIVATCFDPQTGEPVFTDDDVDWLRAQPASAVDGVATAGLRVSGLTEAIVADAGQFSGKSDGS